MFGKFRKNYKWKVKELCFYHNGKLRYNPVNLKLIYSNDTNIIAIKTYFYGNNIVKFNTFVLYGLSFELRYQI